MNAGRHTVLTLDIGLSAVKTAAFRADGRVMALHEAANAAVENRGRCSEMNLPRLWELVCAGIAHVLAQGVPASTVAGIGLSAAGNGLYLVRHSGEDVLGITSMDTRADAVVSAWQQSPLAAQMLAVTANHLWAGQPLPILTHLRDHDQLPDDYRLLFCKDWLRHRLTGEFVTDRSDASAAGLLNVRTGEWAAESFKAVGAGDVITRLPRLVDSTVATGAITGKSASETGLPVGIPVFGGGIDLALGAWADGLGAPDVLHVTAGTWSINQQPCTSLDDIDMQTFLQTIIAPAGCHYTLVDSSPTSAINLELLCGMTGEAEPDFERWEGWLRDTRLGADDPIYLPYPSGTWDLPEQRAEFHQLGAGLTTGQVVAAVYDGIALGHVRQIRKFQQRGPLGKLVVCGGMTRNATWCQRLCDYANLPLEVAENPHSSSWGAALCAFTGLGVRVGTEPRARQRYMPDARRVCGERIETLRLKIENSGERS